MTYKSAAEFTYDRLRNDILGGEFLPGAQIIEAEWARRLGVSVTPLREALRRLEAEGLVVRRQHRDVRIRPFTLVEARSVYEFRAVLDPLAVGLATAHMTVNETRRLDEVFRFQTQMQADGRLRELEQGNYEFHTMIARFSRNVALWETVDRLWLSISLLRAVAWSQDANRPREATDEHEMLLNAMKRKSVDEAVALSRSHAKRAWQRVEEALQKVFADPDGGENNVGPMDDCVVQSVLHMALDDAKRKTRPAL